MGHPGRPDARDPSRGLIRGESSLRGDAPTGPTSRAATAREPSPGSFLGGDRGPRGLTAKEISEILGVSSPASARESAAAAEPLTSICLDDRTFDGDLFVAIRGTRYDTHTSLPRLRGTRVRAVVAETPPPAGNALPWFQVRDSRRALGLLEQARWNRAGTSLETFGITGTNGKSSTVRIFTSILEAAGRQVGWWTTVDRFLGPEIEACSMTTPGPAELARALAECRESGRDACVLEVSSHALDQGRVAGVSFAGAALTQLSRDHLDYHGDFRAYRDAKLRLGDERSAGAPFVLPATDEFRTDLPDLRAPIVRHSLDPKALGGEPGGTVLMSSFEPTGLRAQLLLFGETVDVESVLRGPHNLQNLLVAATLARAVGISLEAIEAGSAAARPVAGRLEEIVGGRGRIFVDYAHTPDALDAVLASVGVWVEGRLLVVFGCGGDRDRGKRPEMGAAAARHADRVIVTSDNPRSEDPDAIIEEILAGIPAGTEVSVESDRRAAIALALDELSPGDVLVIAGKGHEAEQIVGDERLPFDDRQVVAALLVGGSS